MSKRHTWATEVAKFRDERIADIFVGGVNSSGRVLLCALMGRSSATACRLKLIDVSADDARRLAADILAAADGKDVEPDMGARLERLFPIAQEDRSELQ